MPLAYKCVKNWANGKKLTWSEESDNHPYAASADWSAASIALKRQWAERNEFNKTCRIVRRTVNVTKVHCRGLTSGKAAVAVWFWSVPRAVHTQWDTQTTTAGAARPQRKSMVRRLGGPVEWILERALFGVEYYFRLYVSLVVGGRPTTKSNLI